MIVKNILVENMDLIGGYLLIILILLTANVALLAGNYRINNIKLILKSSCLFIITFALLHASRYFDFNLVDYFSYFFIVLTVVVFVLMLLYMKNRLESRVSIYVLLAVLFVSTFLLASQSDLALFDQFLYSFFAFLVMFIVYNLSKLLTHAKRDYPIIVGEFMCLSSILLFILALTYDSTRSLDYSMFTSFLILTPTYQLIYFIIGLIVILIIGFLYNDNKGGNS